MIARVEGRCRDGGHAGAMALAGGYGRMAGSRGTVWQGGGLMTGAVEAGSMNGAGTQPAAPRAPELLRVTAFDRALALGAVVLLGCVIAAVMKGRADWARVPAVVWAHLGTIVLAVGLTPVMLLRRRGDRRHRSLGYVWVAAMAITAVSSLFVRLINPGHFSVIHVLSVWTLIQVPLIVLRARQHDWRRHRGAVRGMVLGALLIAGFFTFPFNRMLGQWLFG
ncbi:MAG: DUF2306 domain-containing protein [Novosphingobium sp.]